MQFQCLRQKKRIGDNPSLITQNMGSCLMNFDIEQRFDDKFHILFIIRILYIAILLMAFSFVAWMMRKLPRHLKKLIQGFVVLTNLVPNFIFKLSGQVIIGPLWSKIVWIMQKDVQYVNSMQISFINLQNPYTLLQLHSRLMLGDQMWLDH